LKSDVVKFDGKNNFGMWRCEVMNALMTSNLEDTLRLEKKYEITFEEDWDKMNLYYLMGSTITGRVATSILQMVIAHMFGI